MKFSTAAATYWKKQGSTFVALVDHRVWLNYLHFERCIQNPGFGAGGGAHPGPAGVAARARRSAGFLAVGDRQPGRGRDAGADRARELCEETGLDAARYGLGDWRKQNQYEIYKHWRHRYAPGVTHNTEHVFSLQVPQPLPVTLAPREHLHYEWLPWREAADKVFSWSNAEAIRELPQRIAAGTA